MEGEAVRQEEGCYLLTEPHDLPAAPFAAVDGLLPSPLGLGGEGAGSMSGGWA
jgi:hypothetical protein